MNRFLVIVSIVTGILAGSIVWAQLQPHETHPDFIDQMRPSFEEYMPLTDEQWDHFKIALAHFFTTADEEQWTHFKKKTAEHIPEMQWMLVQALIVGEAHAFLDGEQR